MSRSDIQISTDDGTCRASLFVPAGKGPWPGVLMFMDGIGYRPALFEIGERIAEHGYVVLLPDLFYRVGDYDPADPKTLFTDPAKLAEWRAKFFSTMSQDNTMRDTRSFLDYLAKHEDVRQPHVGTTGYCMGGGFSLAAAGFYPDRVAAAASFHGARLVTDDPTSPHLLAPKMKARIYVAGAIEDAGFPDEQKQRLDDALTDAHIAHTVETYPAKHGWVPSDTPVHDPAQAERHYTALFNLFDSVLRS